jgi:prevent-host-death family protein
MPWKLADAKNKFTEVFNKALAGEPQFISRRGEEVVVMSKRDYDKATKKSPKKKNFIEHLLSMPQIEELDLTREPWRERDIDFGFQTPSKARSKAKPPAKARRAAE